jgi:hypothetical protein
MQTKTLQQAVTFKASPREVYDMLMDSKKHRSLSGEPAKISKKVGGKFTAWGSHLSGINLVLKPGKKIDSFIAKPRPPAIDPCCCPVMSVQVRAKYICFALTSTPF